MSSTGTLAAGTLVAGRYRIEEPLAGDGSGAVYRAADTRLDRNVALRALPSAEAGGAQQGKAAARLVHPNVARVLDFGTDVELAAEYVVADLGTGGSLAALLAQRGVPPLQLAMRMIQEAAAGMAAAHRAGLVHGDLHPGVLWLSRDEGRLRVQVLGLGLNPAGSPPPRATARYAAPERLRRARELGSAADVFSLGVIAYEVFAGLPADWTQLLLQMARGQAVVAPSLLEARPDFPAHVAQAVRRALAADPASRWPDAGDFAAHLIADLANQPPAETPAVPVPAIVAAPVVVQEPAPAASFESAVPVAGESASQPIAAELPDDDADEVDLSTLAQEAVRAMANAGPAIDPTVAEPEPVVEPVSAAEPVAVVEPVVKPIAVAEPQPVMAEAVAAPAVVAAAVVAAAAEPIAAEEIPAAAPVEIAPIVPSAPEPVIAEVVSSAAAASAPADVTPPAAPSVDEPPKPTRQPLTAGRRGKPIALASTDLADTLYIPPTLVKPESTPAAASAEKPAAASAEKPAAPPAGKIVAPPMMAAPAAPAPSAPIAPVAPAPVAPPVKTVVAEAPPASPAPIALVPLAPAADETLLAAYAPPAVTEAAVQETVAAAPADDIPAIPERRRRGMERLGRQPSGGNRGLLAAGIVVALLVAGGVVAKTVLAGGPDGAVPVQNLASTAAAKVGGAAPVAQPQAPAMDSTVPAAVPDTAALPNPALTPAEQRKQDEERRRAEEQRRQQQRQQDSLRRVQLAAATAAQQAAVPQQVALQNAPRPSAPTAGPQLVQRAPAAAAAPPPAPAPAPEPSRPAADPNRLYSADELDTRPSLANRAAFQNAVNRTYPGTLRGSNTWGSAVVSFVVLPDGRVDRSSVTVEQASQAAFRGAAAAAIANARFNPARVGGQPVRTTVSMPITWNGGGQDDD